jgi:TrmH family RNA methyltransferase
MREITSSHNPLIRKVEQLQRKSRARKSKGMFIIEGKREIMLAVKGGYHIPTILVCLELFFDSENHDEQQIIDSLELHASTEIITVPVAVYEKLAYRSGTEGCIAFAEAKPQQLSDLNLSENPLILIAESPEKPGNLGALLRTADAAKVDAVIIVDPTTDLYNPNVIRSSVGCLFTVPVAVGNAREVVDFLMEKSINLYAATLQTSDRYDLKDYALPTAIAVGTEATGLSEELRNAAVANVIIPMSGAIDSMNVSVSAAILLFEAKRQRQFK